MWSISQENFQKIMTFDWTVRLFKDNTICYFRQMKMVDSQGELSIENGIKNGIENGIGFVKERFRKIFMFDNWEEFSK